MWVSDQAEHQVEDEQDMKKMEEDEHQVEEDEDEVEEDEEWVQVLELLVLVEHIHKH